MASSYGTDADKSSLRANYLTARRRIDPATKRATDSLIAAQLAKFDIFLESELVLVYVSRGNEVGTLEVIKTALAAGKRVAVPRVNERRKSLSFYEIRSLDELQPGFKGILEPTGGRMPLGTKDFIGSVCLVPGLVFDSDGHRIGYGGGYYDRFLPFYPGDKIALARGSQVSSNPLPVDDNDVPVDFIVTESGVWQCR